jgi:hypothetical protein
MQVFLRRFMPVLILFILFYPSYKLTALVSDSQSSQRSTAKSEKKQTPAPAAESAPPLGENAYCDKGNIAHFGEKDGPAELPKTCYYTGLDGTPSPGKQIRVASGSDLSAAVDKAECGDTLLLAAGASFSSKGFPKKKCDDQHYITIRTDTPDSKLPPEGTRISPAWAGVASLPGRPAYAQPAGGPANLMATIVAGDPAGITFGDHYRFIGIQWAPQEDKKFFNLLWAGNGADHLIFDRNWMHGVDGKELGHGITTNKGVTYFALIHSYLNDFTCMAKIGACTDATAVGGGNSDDPVNTLKIVDNFLESSGENILFGGARSKVRPTDVEIRRNHFFKPMFWNPNAPDHKEPTPIVKNLFELKSALRFLIEGNFFENSWGGFSQVGPAIVLNPGHQRVKMTGELLCPDCAVTDITVRYNRVRRANQLFQMANAKDADHPPAGNSYSVHDILADGMMYPDCGKACAAAMNEMVGGPRGTPKEYVIHDVTVNHVTYVIMQQPRTFLVIGGPPADDQDSGHMYNIAWTNIIGDAGMYGVWGVGGHGVFCTDDMQTARNPKARLDLCWGATMAFKNNVLAGGSSVRGGGGVWPDGNFFPASQDAIGFVKLNGGVDGDYHLAPQSPYKGKGSDGKDPGADVDLVLKYTQGIE